MKNITDKSVQAHAQTALLHYRFRLIFLQSPTNPLFKPVQNHTT